MRPSAACLRVRPVEVAASYGRQVGRRAAGDGAEERLLDHGVSGEGVATSSQGLAIFDKKRLASPLL